MGGIIELSCMVAPSQHFNQCGPCLDNIPQISCKAQGYLINYLFKIITNVAAGMGLAVTIVSLV